MSEATLNGKRRVVITGVGMVTPLGNDVGTTWENLVAGESGAGPITQFDATGYSVRFACELKDFEPTTWIERKQARRMDRFSQMALSAARMAEEDSGYRDRRGVGQGGRGRWHRHRGSRCLRGLLPGPARARAGPDEPLLDHPDHPEHGRGLGLDGARDAGPARDRDDGLRRLEHGIGDGLDAIRLDRADVMLCGGTEAPVTRVGIAGFSAMRALSQRNDDPKRGSRPFDADRDGFVMGEAGAMLVLEELEHAQQRGAKIYAEVLGYGTSSDALTSPSPTRRGRTLPARCGWRSRMPASSRGGRLRECARDLDAARRPGGDPGAQDRAR